jgi:signal transduction histidine kinase
MDSLGLNNIENIEANDIKEALALGKGVWTGNVSYDEEPVMAVSMLLTSKGEDIGIVRFVSSLGETNRVIGEITRFLLIMGLVVVAISGILSVFLANSIVKPLKEITDTAEKMADGQLKIRSEIKINDEIGRLAQTLNYMADEISRKESLKNDFISSISHELRTPLTSIKGWAITLKNDSFDDRELIQDGLEIIESESDRLSKMVEELLDFSRFTSGRISLVKELIDIKTILINIVYQMMPRAINNDIDFTVDIPDDITPIIGDENRIKQVLINILDNAFKFTDKGEVHLQTSEDDNYIIIEVKDNGPGISDEDMPYIKEKFYKGKNAKSNSGIGLSICDEIINLHEGLLEIESVNENGTVVKIYLPKGKGANTI